MDDLTKEFKPCVIVFDDPKRTEMVLRDCGIVWQDTSANNFELGYDMETGDLVAVRIYGDVSRRLTTGRRRRFGPEGSCGVPHRFCLRSNLMMAAFASRSRRTWSV